MLEADPKESLAFTLVMGLRLSATGTAVGISRYALLVEELLQFQLKNP